MVDGEFITLVIKKLGGVGLSICVTFTKNQFKFNIPKNLFLICKVQPLRSPGFWSP